MREETLTCANYKVEAAWCLRSGHRLIWSLPLTAGLMLVIAVLLLRGNTEDPKANYARSLGALMAFVSPPVPKSENANEDYKLAIKSYVAYSGPSESNPLWHTDDDSKYFDDPATLTFWSANATVIRHLQAGAQKERCDWGIDLSVIPWGTTSLVTAREHANLLAVDARCRAHKGDHPGAAKSLAAIHKLARHLEGPPSLLSSMISIAIDCISNDALEAILLWDTPSTQSDLAAYRQALTPLGNPYERYARGLEAESAHNLCLMDGVVSGAILLPRPKWPSASDMISPLSYGSDRRCYEAVSKEMVATLRKGRQPAIEHELFDQYQSGPAPFSNQALSYSSRCVAGVIITHEHALLDDVALAFLQYRLKNGHDPKSIAELVPEFLPAMPVGAVNNEPVRLRTDILGAEFSDKYTFNDYLAGKPAIRIYTVGPDGKDDGASSRDYHNKQSTDDTIVILPVMNPAAAKQEQK